MKIRLIALCAVFVTGCGAATPKTNNRLTERSVSQCHARDNGMLPDPKCTPGAIDPSIKQSNIQNTICVSGYTATVRPSVSYTNKLKVEQIAEYGYTDPNLHDYEEDHLASLELGGSPSNPKNLWPEFPKSPNQKDKLENLLHKLVCSNTIKLSDAQREITTNWIAAYKRYFGGNP